MPLLFRKEKQSPPQVSLFCKIALRRSKPGRIFVKGNTPAPASTFSKHSVTNTSEEVRRLIRNSSQSSTFNQLQEHFVNGILSLAPLPDDCLRSQDERWTVLPVQRLEVIRFCSAGLGHLYHLREIRKPDLSGRAKNLFLDICSLDLSLPGARNHRNPAVRARLWSIIVVSVFHPAKARGSIGPD